MAYREVERELELVAEVGEELEAVSRQLAVRDDQTGKVRGWRLNIRRRIERLESGDAVNCDTAALLKAEIKAVNDWLAGSVLDVDVPVDQMGEAVVSQDDVFRTYWERTAELRGIASALPEKAGGELNRQLNAVEDELRSGYTMLGKWWKAVEADIKTDARAHLAELKAELCRAYGRNVVMIVSEPSVSRIMLEKNDRMLSARADELHRLYLKDRDAFVGEFPASDGDVVRNAMKRHLTSSDVESLLARLIDRRTENAKTEYCAPGGKRLKYHAMIVKRLSWRKLAPLMIRVEKPLGSEVIAELEGYMTGACKNTIAHADRINQIAREYGTLALDVTGRADCDTGALKKRLRELTALAKSMKRGNSVHGAQVVEEFVQAAGVMLKKADTGTRAFGRARTDFTRSADGLREWVYGNWYQFGGTPDNHKKSFSGDVSTYVKPEPAVSWQGGTGKDRVD